METPSGVLWTSLLLKIFFVTLSLGEGSFLLSQQPPAISLPFDGSIHNLVRKIFLNSCTNLEPKCHFLLAALGCGCFKYNMCWKTSDKLRVVHIIYG